ncbi:unnamed protein product [Gadus morhua 'NCC']
MSKAAEACGCCSPTPDPSAPTASPGRSGPIWDKVSLVSTSPAHDGALCVGPPAARYSGTGGLTAVGVAAGNHDVVKRGYMGKAELHHRRYFVLSAGSPTRPALLEWYDTEERFKEMEKHPAAAGKALFGCHKRRVINLRCCLGVSKVSSTSKGHTVALYAKDYTLVMVAEDTGQQEDWYWAVKRLIEEEQRYEDDTEERGEGEDEGGERLDDEDDGYCTLTSGVFKEVWLVTVKPRGLGRTKSLAGEMRLCLSADSLVLVRGSAAGWPRLPGVTLPLLSVRRYGHRDGMFFLELGRSAPYGPGEVWMEAVDQADLSLAQQVHEAVREAVRAPQGPARLQALPRGLGHPDTKSPGGGLLRDKASGYMEMAVEAGVDGDRLLRHVYDDVPPRYPPHSARGGLRCHGEPAAASTLGRSFDLHVSREDQQIQPRRPPIVSPDILHWPTRLVVPAVQTKGAGRPQPIGVAESFSSHIPGRGGGAYLSSRLQTGPGRF